MGGSADPFEAALEVARVLEGLGVPVHLGGSLASSVHGLPRATLDADLVADLRPGDGARLAGALGALWYTEPGAMEAAILERRSFNVIHLGTLLKVDVFVRKDTPFSRTSFERSREEAVGDPPVTVRIATPEDTVLHKLLWYRDGGEVSDRQWSDVLGVLRVQGVRLDGEYLTRWARELGLEQLLERALEQAGSGDEPSQPSR